MKIIQIGLLFCQLAFLLSACSGESPQIQYTGISTESAVYLAKNSNSDAEVLAWVERVKGEREPGFDWRIFWSTISEIKLLSRVSSSTQEKILELIPLQCDVETKDQQAQVIMEFPQFYRLLFGQSASCQALVHDEVFSQAFDQMLMSLGSEGLQNNELAQVLVESLTHRWNNGSSLESLRMNLEKRSEVQWNQFIKNLIQQNQPSHVADFILVYEQIYGSDSLTQLLYRDLLQNGEFFQSFVEKMGLLRSVDLLLKMPMSFVQSQSLSQIQWTEIFNFLAGGFSETQFPGRDQNEKLKNRLLTFQSIQRLLVQWQSQFTFQYLLNLDDQLNLEMESSIKQLSDPKNFLDQFELSLSTALLRQRILRDLDIKAVNTLAEFLKNPSPLEELALARMRVYVSKDPQKAHESVMIFCQLLESQGVPSRRLSVQEFALTSLESPGCVFISNESPLGVIPLRGSSSQISLSSILLTDGASVETSQLVGDLSVIDASSLQTHQSLPEEPPLENDHALVFPVAFGFRLEEKTDLLDPGIYYVPFHFLYRSAADGRPAQIQPKKGLPGGDVKIDPSYQGTLPAMISYGGEGQKPVPPRKGGRGDRSAFNWPKLAELLSLSAQDPKGLARSKIRPSISLLDHILSHAELAKGGQQIKVYVNSSALLESLESEQKNKYFKFCNEKNTPIQDCVYEITFQAANQMGAQLQKALVTNSPSFILPQMATDEFSVEPGQLGTVNPPGDQGDNGEIKIEGVE